MIAVAPLFVSNIFMTAAWYGHLKHKDAALWKVIAASWLIAFLEYCFQVPANRLGHGYFSAAQLKIIQEAVTLTVFIGFAWWYLGEKPRVNEMVAAALVMIAVVVAQAPWRTNAETASHAAHVAE
ncbi:MAG: DMT family protein [Planctomycetota bacterium]|nr:DMT family protein [Planctomycetota bacterium]